MSSVGKKTVEDPALAGLAGILDPPFVEALVAAFRSLEVSGHAKAMLDTADSWCRPRFGVAYALGEATRSLVPVTSTAGDEEDPRFLAFSPIAVSRLAQLVGETATSWEGFGPARGLVGEWSGDEPRATLTLPLVSGKGRLAAAIVLLLDSAPDGETIERLATLLRLTRPALDNALRMLAMRDLVIKDDTAQCFNRRHFEESLPEELARATRYRSPLSLIFLDMDNLKEVNTRFGHAMGSQTLHEVSLRVRSKTRKFDKLFRFGGDEFCILLPETDWQGALEVAERVREAIVSRPFLESHVNDGQVVAMSASLGIAAFPLHARSRVELIQRADRAMQRVKKSTKNAVGIAQIEEAENVE
ncbi:MAG TPA: GGDEF domain-containing protein [Candidatus Polarisedimenticolaceae bacterium]|nr:GGDEF domain-containing protein [Candidatus Polarisedimenticolaceae bacterium]